MSFAAAVTRLPEGRLELGRLSSRLVAEYLDQGEKNPFLFMETDKLFRIVLRIVLVVALLPLTALGDDFPVIYNSGAERDQQPMSAEEAAARMQVPEGFRVSVLASEPDVRNPIAMAWDDRGRMWVAENYTYAEKEQRFDLSLHDRVIILEDIDNDGRADSRKVFTDTVQMLTSVELGHGGVWLMCPPYLLFVPDADGDDVADGPAQVMLDGFTVAKDNYHNFANGLRWGPDGWLYGRCGHSCPGRIGVPGTPDELRIPLDGGIWRFHPKHKIAEVLCHGTTNPWGHDWDQHGELFFINTVIGHLWHMIPGAHLKEPFGESMNPAVYQRLDMIADHYHFDTTGGWADSRDGAANELGGGHAHVGMMIYLADQWPERYHHRLFTLNMHGRRANVERLEREGAGFVARHEPDFAIAADPFFRGLEIAAGPDGNVFVLDWSDTGECHEHTGVHRSSGRIYKISYGSPRPPQRLSKPLCLSGSGKLPSLWKQYQEGQTSPQSLRRLLRDPDEHVRAWAIRLLTDLWPLDTIVGVRKDAVHPDDAESRAEFVRMAGEDDSGLVLLTLASTLQRLAVDRREQLAQALVQRDEFADDRDLPAMVWYGLMPLGDRDPMALVNVAKQCRWPATLRWIARNLAARLHSQPQPLNELLTAALSMPSELQDEVLRGVKRAVQGWRTAPKPAAWDALASSEAAERSAVVVRELNILFGDGRALEEIRGIALDEAADIQTRQAALKTLLDARPDDLQSICLSLLNVRILNATAARGLALWDDPEIGRRLARSYHRFHPDDRPAVLETLVSRPSFAKALLENVGERNGQVPRADITAFHARQIRGLHDQALNRQLADVWGELRDSPADRRESLAALRQQLSADAETTADLRAGRVLFGTTCAQCHTLYGDGANIGPDLTGSQRSNLDYLLENIVDPSAVVDKDYRMTVVMTADGRILNGLVVSEDENTLVLQTQTQQQTIPIDDIEDMRQTTLSSMPDGLLNGLSSEQIRDLIAYLMHPSQVPLAEDSQR